MNPSALVFDLRNHKGVSQKDLARGLASVVDLSRFESGQKEFSYFTVEAMVQRLGKSCDKFELRLSVDDYNALFLRQLIQNNLKSEASLMERLYNAYEEIDDSKSAIHDQFLLMIKGCMKYVTAQNAEGAYLLLPHRNCKSHC